MSEKKTAKKETLQKVILIGNIKLNEKRYKKGDSIDVSQDDYEVLLKADVIEKAD